MVMSLLLNISLNAVFNWILKYFVTKFYLTFNTEEFYYLYSQLLNCSFQTTLKNEKTSSIVKWSNIISKLILAFQIVSEQQFYIFITWNRYLLCHCEKSQFLSWRIVIIIIFVAKNEHKKVKIPKTIQIIWDLLKMYK